MRGIDTSTNSIDELSIGGDNDRLSWRFDPKVSLSDYKIKIRVRGGGAKSKSYHVHKTVLAFGSKKSVYFSRLFQNWGRTSALEMTGHSKSIIELEKPAAEAFPQFLDYIYSPEDTLDINPGNAVALHHLALYFEVSRLQKKALYYCKYNMTIDDCGVYYTHARLYDDDQIRHMAVHKCLEELTADPSSADFGVPTQLLQTTCERFWLDILRENNGRSTRFLATCIGVLCFERMATLDPKVFLLLTSEELLPKLSFVAAQQLLFAESVLLPEANTSTELTKLQERCIETLASSWKVVVELGLLLPPQANPRISANLLMCSLEQAKITVENLEERLSQAEGVIPDSIEVFGAGQSHVNGVYERQEKFRNGAPLFVKEGNVQIGDSWRPDEIFLDELR